MNTTQTVHDSTPYVASNGTVYTLDRVTIAGYSYGSGPAATTVPDYTGWTYRFTDASGRVLSMGLTNRGQSLLATADWARLLIEAELQEEALRGAPLARAEYEALCAAHGITPSTDHRIGQAAYGLIHMQPAWLFGDHQPIATTRVEFDAAPAHIAAEAKRIVDCRRLRAIEALRGKQAPGATVFATQRFECTACGGNRDTTLSGHCDDCEA